MTEDARRHAPATLRNREPLLGRLRHHLPATGTVLEVASGTGEHAAFFAAALPGLTWQPSDPNEDARRSIAAHAAGVANVRPALVLDVLMPWPASQADAVLCVNMVHIAPWAATPGLFGHAAEVLAPGRKLLLYGPFLRGRASTPGNLAFDADLRARDPAWGVRELAHVVAAAGEGFGAPLVEDMPAGNLLLVFGRN